MVVSQKEQEVTPAVLARCRRGDREAFRLLYEAYKDKVYSMALYFFHGDAATAADVTQHVFLKLIGNIGQFRGESGFSNACVDRTRMAGAKTRSVDPEVLAELPVPGSQEDDLAHAEVAASVRAAVASLSPTVRMAVVLRYFEDLSYAEMADALNCSIGTVASRLSRGHEMLARLLAPLRDEASQRTKP